MSATELVTVDIGGTHARFAIATVSAGGKVTIDEPLTLHTSDYASFQTAWEEYRASKGGSLPEAVSIAIAGPVRGDVIRFTNNPWLIRPALVKEKLGVSRFTLVNDFAAVTHAVVCATENDYIHLAGPKEPFAETGTISVIGPGTGLGVAQLLRFPGGSYHVQATEGGHMDYPPLDRIEDALLARLRERHTRVSVERIVSGPGIVEIYHALAKLEQRAVPDAEDIEIWTNGLSGTDSLAAAAVDRFCLALGSTAGDIALAQGGFSGVVIAGGLGYRLRDVLPGSGFAERFCAKGRFAGLMASIPVKLIVQEQPGLIGAAAAFAKEHS